MFRVMKLCQLSVFRESQRADLWRKRCYLHQQECKILHFSELKILRDILKIIFLLWRTQNLTEVFLSEG